MPTGGAHDDHAAVNALLEAALAESDGACEVMAVGPESVAAFVQELLHLVEQILEDERLVPAGVALPVGANFFEVVAVAEHLLDLRV